MNSEYTHDHVKGQSNILVTEASADYELLDSGEEEKLERFGHVTLSRPDPQALWKKRLSPDEWKKADGHFVRGVGTGSGAIGKSGHWHMKDRTAKGDLIPERWQIEFGGLNLLVKPTAFKHTGLFPEQSVNWDWTRAIIGEVKKQTPTREIKVLNLFGYTGGATLACAQAGAQVVHVDGSKAAITWARENAELSGLSEKPIRWILEDARVFVDREVKRGNTYDGIIMDPPSFGHGANKELWKIEEHFTQLVEDCMKLFSNDRAQAPIFFLVNGYSAGYSAIAYKNSLLGIVERFGGSIETGELTIEESKAVQDDGTVTAGRLLPCGIFARWKK